MSAKQPDIMLLADAYADASFAQGLNQRTVDPAPELARGALSAGVGVLYAQRDELLAVCVEMLSEMCVWEDELGTHPAATKARAAIAKATNPD
jgi:hypothetical protein